MAKDHKPTGRPIVEGDISEKRAGHSPKAEIGPENVPSGVYQPTEPPASQPSGEGSATSEE